MLMYIRVCSVHDTLAGIAARANSNEERSRPSLKLQSLPCVRGFFSIYSYTIMSVASGRPGTAGLLMVRDGEGMYILLVKYRRYLANHLVKNTVSMSSGCAIRRWRWRLARRFDPSKAGRHSTFNLEHARPTRRPLLPALPGYLPGSTGRSSPGEWGRRDVMSGMTGGPKGCPALRQWQLPSSSQGQVVHPICQHSTAPPIASPALRPVIDAAGPSSNTQTSLGAFRPNLLANCVCA